MPKVLIIQPIHDDGMALFHARDDITCDIVDGSSIEEVREKIVDADGVALRTMVLSADVLERAERLKVVSRHGVGYDNVDLDALNRMGVPLALAADANATAVAEHTLFMMLHLAKRGERHDHATRSGAWEVRNRLEATDIGGKRLLIVGFGRIGKEVAKRCLAFGMHITACDPYIATGVIEAAGCQPVDDFRTVLGETDILTLHTPLTAETRHMIGAAELAALPRHALLVNCARGGIVDEQALAAALGTGQIAGAGVDVFEQEPPPADHPLFALDNVILSPHNAGVSLDAARRMAVSTARNVLAGIDGTLDPAMVVNKAVL
ncbi:MAG: hydroxyacid dehydrogenase [Alphaproteobacteria bacterium]